MKKLFTLIAAAALTLGASAQTITVSSVDETLANDYAGGVEIDVNNDGLKELFVSGMPQWDAAGKTILMDADGNEYEVDRKAWMFTWNGSAYDKKALNTPDMLIGIRGHLIPADFNGDGNVDLYLAGETYDFTGVYLNDGQGNFTKDARYAVKDVEGNELEWFPKAADVADFNQDGLVDVVTIGWSNVYSHRLANAAVLINNGDGTFTTRATDLIGNGEENYELALCTVKAFDLNNDGYPEFMFQGNIDNESGIGAYTSKGNMVRRTFVCFMNLGAETDPEDVVAFYDLGLADGLSHQFGNGNFAVVDFNADGVADIFVTGESPDDAVNGWDYYGQLLRGKITKTAEGNDVQYTDDQTFVARGKDIRPLCSNNVGVRAIDYNADGYYDLFYPGWCPGMLDGGNATQAGWLLPGSAAGLISYQRIPGSSEQGIFFLDYGVEGALNYTFTGYHGDNAYFDGTTFPTGRSMVFTKNPWSVASRPDAPTAPTAQVNDHQVKLSWTPAASSLKNVTYEYYLKEKSTGRIYNASTSFIGGDKDGVRKVLREGNAYMNTEVNVTLPDGTFEWGVQTVNAAQRGSVFAKGQDLVVGTGQFNSISSITETVAEQAVYTLDGKRVATAQKGVNVVKMTDGTVKKVIVK
ncbi:MAG: VCBS repeat-containing protein [Prevotella sp.]|nr:VCBS repeat-containing protein [Prevotella sp.]